MLRKQNVAGTVGVGGGVQLKDLDGKLLVVNDRILVLLVRHMV